MQYPSDSDIRLNAYGQADIDYYLAKARRLRAEAIGNWFAGLKSRLTRLICQPLFGCHGAPVSH